MYGKQSFVNLCFLLYLLTPCGPKNYFARQMQITPVTHTHMYRPPTSTLSNLAWRYVMTLDYMCAFNKQLSTDLKSLTWLFPVKQYVLNGAPLSTHQKYCFWWFVAPVQLLQTQCDIWHLSPEFKIPLQICLSTALFFIWHCCHVYCHLGLLRFITKCHLFHC